ncbi:MAG: hypothetical protein VX970_05470 [Planctomycetota bacterium]|nr:hypothetical protein [Planctomycetota bacterium]
MKDKHPTPNSSFHLWLMLFCTWLVASGASCPRTAWQPFKPNAPVVFSGQEPSLEEVAQVVNANRAKITGIYSTNSRISGTDFPSLRTSLAVGSERNVRLRAGTGVTGQEMDVGSNQEIFWFWVKRAEPPALYYGRYDQYPVPQIAGALPIRPEWLTEAMGLVSLPPHQEHQGPFRRNDGMIEIRSPLIGPTGSMTRILILDAASGYVNEIRLIDARGQLIAAARNSDHFRDPDTGAVLPRKTDIDWPAAGMQLTLKLGDVQIAPLDPQSDLWAKPSYPGFPDVSVTEPGSAPPTAVNDTNPQQKVSPKQLVAGLSHVPVPESGGTNANAREASLWRASSPANETPTQPQVVSQSNPSTSAIRAQDDTLVLPSSRRDAAAKAFRSRIRSDSRRHGAVFHGRD